MPALPMCGRYCSSLNGSPEPAVLGASKGRKSRIPGAHDFPLNTNKQLAFFVFDLVVSNTP